MRSRLLSLRFYYFASFAALGAYAPYFPEWLRARGVVGAEMGLVAGLVPAMGVLAPPAIGLIADALGLRGALLSVACLGASASMFALAASGAAAAPSRSAVLACTFGYAIFRSPMVMLADVVALERANGAGTTYGAVRLWGSVGFLVAAFAVGRAIDARDVTRLPALVAALLFVAFLAALVLPGKSVTQRLPVARHARDLIVATDFAWFLTVTVLAQVAHASYDLCFSLHLRDLGATDATIGLAWTIGVAFEVALLALSDRIVARFGARTLLCVAILGATARWALLASVTSIAALVSLAPLHSLSFALWWAASLAFLKRRAPAHALATAQGLFSAAVAGGSVLGMITWGTVYRRSGGHAVFGAAAGVALVASMLAVRWRARASDISEG